jgi:hypothetical protein
MNDDLPPLPPRPQRFAVEIGPTGQLLDYSAQDMRAYARAALAQPLVAEHATSEPVGWFESPHGAFRANPAYRFQWPSALLSWSVPVYLHPAASQPAAPTCKAPLPVARSEAAPTLMAEPAAKHEWVSDGVSSHNGEYWYRCLKCGAKDWIASYGTEAQLRPSGCSPQPPREPLSDDSIYRLWGDSCEKEKLTTTRKLVLSFARAVLAAQEQKP